jgi:ribonuclease P/MRP protein subunit POP1
MAQPKPVKPPQQQANTLSKKRKEAPTKNNSHSSASKKQKTDHRARQRDARVLSTQTSSKAFANGALDVDAFVRAREFEMQALDSGLQRSKKALNRRAFQQVPKELRRRTASHNVKKVPKRLRERGKKEMIEDNTPTVTARRRKPTKHMRLRIETAKKLRALGAQKRAAKENAEVEKVTVVDPNAPSKPSTAQEAEEISKTISITTRKPKIKRIALAKPPIPKAKFRKRQIHKSWLPTHLFHAKRAHMTPPSAPLWRFAIPLTPTLKSYRPTHRASHNRGAVAWDISYIATIGLEGEQQSLDGLLKALGIGRLGIEAGVWGSSGEKWRRGLRVLETFALEREAPHRLIAPITIVWRAVPPEDRKKLASEGKLKRKLFIRLHPSAFYQLWEEVVRLSKVAKPSIQMEDLRFEIGSIEIIGPGSTEALLGALWPIESIDNATEYPVADTEHLWKKLAGVSDPSALPAGALLAFNVQDPRLRHPPRTIQLSRTQEEQAQLLDLLSKWPFDQTQRPAQVFDRTARLKGSKLASQKAIDRRKSLAKPGGYPTASPMDPAIPVLLYASYSPTTTRKMQKQASWTLVAPWKTIQPIWYSIMYYPLSTGQQPRFGGMREQQQLAFEAGRPWFPADYPGTRAGWEWEVVERRRRWEEWLKRPKATRISWDKVDLGGDRKGEVGDGGSCDWALLLSDQSEKGQDTVAKAANDIDEVANDSTADKQDDTANPTEAPSKPEKLDQISPGEYKTLLHQVLSTSKPLDNLHSRLLIVRINLVGRGVPETCARIYRLPSADSDADLRKAWLDLVPSHHNRDAQKHSKAKHSLPKLSKDAPPHISQQRLAQSLLQPPRAGADTYPACPGVEDLIGFATTGSFNLAAGQGTGIGSLLIGKVAEDLRRHDKEGMLCIVRNAGMEVGRLARWESAV